MESGIQALWCSEDQNGVKVFRAKVTYKASDIVDRFLGEVDLPPDQPQQTRGRKVLKHKNQKVPLTSKVWRWRQYSLGPSDECQKWSRQFVDVVTMYWRWSQLFVRVKTAEGCDQASSDDWQNANYSRNLKAGISFLPQAEPIWTRSFLLLGQSFCAWEWWTGSKIRMAISPTCRAWRLWTSRLEPRPLDAREPLPLALKKENVCTEDTQWSKKWLLHCCQPLMADLTFESELATLLDFQTRSHPMRWNQGSRRQGRSCSLSRSPGGPMRICECFRSSFPNLLLFVHCRQKEIVKQWSSTFSVGKCSTSQDQNFSPFPEKMAKITKLKLKMSNCWLLAAERILFLMSSTILTASTATDRNLLFNIIRQQTQCSFSSKLTIAFAPLLYSHTKSAGLYWGAQWRPIDAKWSTTPWGSP